ncbi:MAG: hypothetical protein HZA77_08865 [Candidatus Schekmanbacteria bacterium]|nr:hypothetical protein [Candidatus Schekmanbacteria bacterium]
MDKIYELKDKVFLLDPSSHMNGLIAERLKVIVREISKLYPDCSILLGGSMAYGEGKIKISEDGTHTVASDADIFLVFPSLFKCLAARKDARLLSISGLEGALKSVEFVVAWEGALKLNLTTIAGEPLKESSSIVNTLNSLHAPEPINNLKRAYKFLIKAVSMESGSEEFYRKSVIQAFQALLLANERKFGYNEWKNFYSLKYCIQKAENYSHILDKQLAVFVQNAISCQLSGREVNFSSPVEQYRLISELLRIVRDKVSISFKLNDYLRFMAYHFQRKQFINPFTNSTILFFETADKILELFDKQNISENEALDYFLKLTGEKLDPAVGVNKIIKKMADVLMVYDKAYLHKVS